MPRAVTFIRSPAGANIRMGKIVGLICTLAVPKGT
jgi:hypothetical protein